MRSEITVKEWILAHLPESIVGVLVGLVGWLAQRAIAKVDRQEARIAALENKSVTKEDLAELRESMNSTFVNGMTRLEMRQDQILFHIASDDK
jgi:hypothetical protein